MVRREEMGTLLRLQARGKGGRGGGGGRRKGGRGEREEGGGTSPQCVGVGCWFGFEPGEKGNVG